MAAVLIPDASHYQGSPDWAQVAAFLRTRTDAPAVILKATEGTSYGYESWFRENSAKAKAAGLLVGAYHYLIVAASGPSQGDYFARVAEGADFFAVDIEQGKVNGSATAAQIVATATQFSFAAGHALGRPIGLYGRSFLLDKGVKSKMGCSWLWAPRYNSELGDTTSFGWERATLWQYTDGHYNFTSNPSSIPGIGACDVSVLLGDLSEMTGVKPSYTDVAVLNHLGVSKVYRGPGRVWRASRRATQLLRADRKGVRHTGTPASVSITVKRVKRPK